MPCAHWLARGRLEVDSEPTREGIERLHRHPPQPWIPTPVTRKLFTELCCVSPTPGRFSHHQGPGASLGYAARNGSAFDLGVAFGCGAALRRLA
jgi:hypothetical protein